MAKRGSKSSGIIKSAFDEVYSKTPKVVTKTAAKFGAARAQKQRVAIALSKARKAGARGIQRGR
jgi:hypothetical protein